MGAITFAQFLGDDALTAGELGVITSWLDLIQEQDPLMRSEVLQKCGRDAEARAYFLERGRFEVAEFQRLCAEYEAAGMEPTTAAEQARRNVLCY